MPARLSKEEISLLKPNSKRMMDSLHETCRFGAGVPWSSDADSTQTGMSRLALSDADREVRDWFCQKVRDLGCQITVDAMGNIFAIRPGRNQGPATFAGSHLDTQPTGGRYDGILGIHAGVEMLEVLEDNKIETEFPVGVVNWTNEEGARFPMSMMGSGVWAGSVPLDAAHSSRDVKTGVTMLSELERIGYSGPSPADYNHMPMAAHFELHIEQGPRLENEKKKIGVVLGVQGYKWFTITVTGEECHTGTTDMASRSDPLHKACKMILRTQRAAVRHSALAGTGILTVEPGSTNTVPGKVSFSLDLRASSDQTLKKLTEKLRYDFECIAEDTTYTNKTCKVEWRTDFKSPVIKFNKDCVACVREAAQSIFPEDDMTLDMTSGAGHDSVCANRVCPTSMIFVPSQNGVSHNPHEYTSPEDCTVGAEVLMKSVLSYDKLRAERAAHEGTAATKTDG
ncbi:N-carbamoyl-L-amino acid hydrolase [Saccharata proteae CBS 121410]|uniref:N-carbamoyl-L-amino acid hydrolase n=1 Tax=Saccharata proteae CBS 121410 TaxID=1314787 RepID=A0A9P4M0M6_9PEZI|nr:N-carbamoyl-L-amino acid hydrolase [Saccharata proteae CBS 121410]